MIKPYDVYDVRNPRPPWIDGLIVVVVIVLVYACLFGRWAGHKGLL